jgi:hypothetical protein
MNSLDTSERVPNDRKRAERLEIAHGLYRALMAQDPNRAIILCDSNGRMVARHDPEPKLLLDTVPST